MDKSLLSEEKENQAKRGLSNKDVEAIKKAASIAFGKDAVGTQRWWDAYDRDVITINQCRNGRMAVWVFDIENRESGVKETAVYVDSLRKLSGKEIEDQLQ